MAIEEEKIVRSDLDFIADSKEAVVTETPGFAKYTLYLLISLLAATIAWAAVSQIDLVTVVNGRVVSSANLQLIQHLEGGIIKSIEVSEGEKVKKGQVLARFDNTQFSAAYNRDLAKKHVLEVEMYRLESEAAGKEVMAIPDEIRKRSPQLVANAQQLFDRDKKALNEQLEILRKNLTLTERELKIVKPLAERGAISTIERIRLEREINRIRVQIGDRIEKARTEAAERLNQIKAELRVLQEQILSSEDRNKRTVMRSPMDGIVNKLYVTTIGEVISPGNKLMEIVPDSSNLTFIVSVRPEDIGFLELGQKASVKITAYDYSVYGSLDAKITNIGADALTDKDGSAYYEVKLQADKTFLGSKDKPLRIIPGMTVTANIITGKRTLLEYLIKPFIDISSSAFKTR